MCEVAAGIEQACQALCRLGAGAHGGEFDVGFTASALTPGAGVADRETREPRALGQEDDIAESMDDDELDFARQSETREDPIRQLGALREPDASLRGALDQRHRLRNPARA